MNLSSIAAHLVHFLFGDNKPQRVSSSLRNYATDANSEPKKKPIKPRINISSPPRMGPAIETNNERRKRTSPPAKIEPLPLDARRWLTVKEMTARYPCFTEKSLRHLIYSAESYAKYPKPGLRSNGFIDCIVRVAGQRKILIDTIRFEAWLEAHKQMAPVLNTEHHRQRRA